VATGEIGEESTGFGEHRGVAVATCVVCECLSDVSFSDADGAVQDDGLASGDVAASGEVTDVGGGNFRVVTEVEVFDGGELLETRLTDPSGDRGGVASGNLVLTEHLKKLEVAELTGLGLMQSGVESVKHA